jgi:hypothetical protein
MLELSNVKRAPKIDFSTGRHNSQHRKRERAVRVTGNQERDALGEPIERAEWGDARGLHPITRWHAGVRTGARVRPVRTQFFSLGSALWQNCGCGWNSCGCDCNGKMTSLVKLKSFSKVFGKMIVVVASLYFSCHMWGRSREKPLFLASPPYYKLQNDFSIASGWKPFFVRCLAGFRSRWTSTW